MKKILPFFIFLCCSHGAWAESLTTAITNAHIFTVGTSGEIALGTIIFDEQGIKYVGSAKNSFKADIVIDAKGQIVTPGLIISDSIIGVDEVSAVTSTVNSKVGNTVLSAAIRMSDSINFRSTLIPIARMTGATAAVVTPALNQDAASGSLRHLFSGQVALINLNDDFNNLVHANPALALLAGENGARNSGGSVSSLMAMFKTQIDEVRSYISNKSAYERNQFRSLLANRADLEALVPVVQGRMPILVDVHRASEIIRIIEFCKKESLKLILSGVSEGWIVAREIASARIPVILNGHKNLPYAFESLSASQDNAVKLAKAGVQVSIHGDDFLSEGKSVRLFAGFAVRNGMPWGEALKTITLNPAKAFGVASKIGSIEVGKQADIVLWHGDPLDTSGYATRIFIKGKEMPMESRQTKLRDRYLSKDNGLPFQYR